MPVLAGLDQKKFSVPVMLIINIMNLYIVQTLESYDIN